MMESSIFNHNYTKNPYYNLNKANFRDTNIIFAKYDWSNFYKVNDGNVVLNIFYGLGLDTMEKTVPKTLTHTHKFLI